MTDEDVLVGFQTTLVHYGAGAGSVSEACRGDRGIPHDLVTPRKPRLGHYRLGELHAMEPRRPRIMLSPLAVVLALIHRFHLAGCDRSA